MAVSQLTTKSLSRRNQTLPPLFILALTFATVTTIFHSWNFKELLDNSQKDISSTSSQEIIKSQAYRCNTIKDASFNSQDGEDQYLLSNFFKGICGGSYIEMGALDGELFSNSVYFNRALGWKGLLVEADPASYEQLAVNRQDELVPPIHAAVCDEERDVHWVGQLGVVSGIVEFAPKTFQEQWWNEEIIRSAAVVKCKPLTQIIHDAFVEKRSRVFFDFFSLDVEGAEHEVVKTIDFDEISFGVIFYEADNHNPLKNMALRNFLESKGYRFMVEYGRSFWHVNIDFARIYGDIVHDL